MATRYWVGGSGNWSDNTNHWSDSSGGSPGASKPTSSDDVVFDTNSHNSDYTCTVNETSYCDDFTLNNPSSGAVTLAGTSSLRVSGNFLLASGSSFTHTSSLNFYGQASVTKTITTNSVTIYSRIYFYISSSTHQLQDDLNCAGSTIYLGSGVIFDPNSHDVNVEIGSGTTLYIYGNFTFYNLSVTSIHDYLSSLYLVDNITITNSFTANGYSATSRLLILSIKFNEQRSITAESVTITNCDFQDVNAAGNADWDLSGSTGGCASGGNNTGITFTTPTSRYWVATSGGYWYNTTSWSTSDGGGSGASVPLIHDTVYFTSNSITSDDRSIDIGSQRLASIDFSNVTNSPKLAGANSPYFFGSVNLTGIGSITSTRTFYFTVHGSSTLNTNNLTLPNSLYLSCESFTLQSNLSITNDLYLGAGIIDFNDYNVDCGKGILSYTTTNVNSITVYLKSGTFTLCKNISSTTSIDFANHSYGCTLYAGTSTIVIDNDTVESVTFQGSSKTFNNLTIGGTGDYTTTIYGSNTFNVFSAEDEPKTIKFNAGATNTFSYFNVSGSSGKLITIQSNSAASSYLTCDGIYRIKRDYLDITYLSVSPDEWWYAGTHSTDSGNNFQWYFTDAPAFAKNFTSDLVLEENKASLPFLAKTDSFVLEDSKYLTSYKQFIETLLTFDLSDKEISVIKTIFSSLYLEEKDDKENRKFFQEVILFSENEQMLNAKNISEMLFLVSVGVKNLTLLKSFSENILLYESVEKLSNYSRLIFSELTLSEQTVLKNEFYRLFSETMILKENNKIENIRYLTLSAIIVLTEIKYNLLTLSKSSLMSLLEVFSSVSITNKNFSSYLDINEEKRNDFEKELSSLLNVSVESKKEQKLNIAANLELIDFSEKIKNITKIFRSVISFSLFLCKYFRMSEEDSFSYIISLLTSSVFEKEKTEMVSFSDSKVLDISKKIVEIEEIIENLKKENILKKNSSFVLTEKKTKHLSISTSSLFNIYETKYLETNKKEYSNVSLEDVVLFSLNLNKKDSLIIQDSLKKNFKKFLDNSFDISETIAKTEVLDILANIEFSDSFNTETSVIISDLIRVYESIKNEISIPIGSVLVISEEIEKHSKIPRKDSFNSTDEFNKTINVGIADLEEFTDSLSKISSFEYDISTPLEITDSIKYVKSEFYLRKVVLLTKSNKAMLLVRSD